MKRIAPTLQMITDSSWGKTETGGKARGELRALLAVARAAREASRGDGKCPPKEGCRDCALARALARLDRASGKTGGGA